MYIVVSPNSYVEKLENGMVKVVTVTTEFAKLEDAKKHKKDMDEWDKLIGREPSTYIIDVEQERNFSEILEKAEL